VKPGNLTEYTAKVLNPAVYPEDEELMSNDALPCGAHFLFFQEV